ncbi:MAG TPA: metallophosphoesterase [Tepidisphaeraceae bacterium]|jgi:hypothetical protein
MVRLLIIFFLLIPANAFFWREADRRLRRLPLGAVWRVALAAFVAAQVAYALWSAVGVFVENLQDPGPAVWPTAAYVWHILLLPAGCLLFLCGAAWRWWRERKPETPAQAAPASSRTDPALPTRRQILAGAAAAAAVPPLICMAVTARARQQEGTFRIRRITLDVPQLPADLDGLTIAHVTDLHIGRFMPVALTAPVADATNALEPDLIVFAGDLMDTSEDRVAFGIDFIRRLRPRHGLVMIEGNHDVMHDAPRFEGAVKDAGLPLLLDESKTFRLPGRPTPVQCLGITWGELKTGAQLHRHGRDRNRLFREPTDEAREASVRRVAAMREPGAFPILLAHHPHAFDRAADVGLPLVLSGHTHGGQIMLTEHIGAGPIRFRYWTGLYRKPDSQLFISNGIGSWFPLRVNAPSEIVHITLKSTLSGANVAR